MNTCLKLLSVQSVVDALVVGPRPALEQRIVTHSHVEFDKYFIYSHN